MEKLIYGKIANILNEVPAVTKNKRNEHGRYQFRGIDDMYNCIHPLFSKHRVFISSKVLNQRREERKSKSGGLLIYTILDVEFSFFAEDGSFVTSVMVGEAMDSSDKSTNKAMSAALKYALMQMFLVPTEEQADADKNTPEPLPKMQQPQKFDLNKDLFNKAIIRVQKGDYTVDGIIEKLGETYAISQKWLNKFEAFKKEQNKQTEASPTT